MIHKQWWKSIGGSLPTIAEGNMVSSIFISIFGYFHFWYHNMYFQNAYALLLDWNPFHSRTDSASLFIIGHLASSSAALRGAWIQPTWTLFWEDGVGFENYGSSVYVRSYSESYSYPPSIIYISPPSNLIVSNSSTAILDYPLVVWLTPMDSLFVFMGLSKHIW